MKTPGIYTFTANTAGSEESDDVLTVGVAEEFGPYFMIQRPLAKPAIEASELYVEYGDQSNGCYGAIELLSIDRNNLVARLANGERVDAVLQIADDVWITLVTDLKRCFAGLDSLLNLKQ
jgi:hypothetical protein